MYKSPWSLFLQGLAQAHPKISEGGGSAQWAKVSSIVYYLYIHMRLQLYPYGFIYVSLCLCYTTPFHHTLHILHTLPLPIGHPRAPKVSRVPQIHLPPPPLRLQIRLKRLLTLHTQRDHRYALVIILYYIPY